MSTQASRWLRAALVLAALAASVALVSALGEISRLLLISALIAYILNPVANYLEYRGLGRTSATVLVFAAMVLGFALFAVMLLPNIREEIRSIRTDIGMDRAAATIDGWESAVGERLELLGLEAPDLSGKLREAAAGAGDRVFRYFIDAVSLITNMMIIPFIVFFLLKDGRQMKKGLVRAVPNRYFELTLNLMHKIDRQIGNYLRGQLIDSLIIGALSVLALMALDIPYYLLIGAFAGIANLVPFVGPLVGAVPAVIAAVMETGDMSRALYVVLAFLVVQLIDNAVVKPLVVGKMVSMHPLTILLVVIVGGKFFGILGMFLSVPAAGIVKVAAAETALHLRKYRLA